VDLASVADSMTGITLHHALLRHAERRPERPFFESAQDPSYRPTYGELEALTSGTARSLLRLGVRPADRVAVLMGPSLEYVAAALAVQRIGAIYVPCSSLFSDEALAHVLRQTTASWIIVDEANAGQLERTRTGASAPPGGQPRVIGPPRLDWVTATLAETLVPATTSLAPPAAGDEVAMISFTSGTTALPKGVTFTHGNWLHCAINMVSGLHWGSDERVLHQLPLHPANGGLVVLAPSLLRGSTIVLDEGFAPWSFASLLAAQRISLAFVSGRNVQQLLAQPPSAADRLHSCQRMAQRLELSAPDKRLFEQRYGVTLISAYGCSETLGPVVFGSRDLPTTEGSVGRAIAGYEIGVAGPDATADDGADDGAVGEFVVRSLSRHGLSPGYWSDEASSRALLRDGWLHTGDAVRIDQQGCVHYLGRLADVSGQAARIIATRQVERLIRALPGVTEAIVVLDPARDEHVALVVADAAVDSNEILRRCHGAPGGGALRIVRADSIPRDILGKVNRRELCTLLEQTGPDRLP
jgi:crotonobetaine/carnitine-CoA ligase